MPADASLHFASHFVVFDAAMLSLALRGRGLNFSVQAACHFLPCLYKHHHSILEFVNNPGLHCLLRSDEMYVFSTSQKRVSVEFVGKNKVQEKLKNFNDLTSASVAYMGVSSIGPPDELKSLVPSKYCYMRLYPSCPFYVMLSNKP